MCFVAVHLYMRFSEHAKVSSGGEPLWALAGMLEFVFLSFFAIFVAQMNKNYRITFFSTMTGRQYCALRFRQAKTDETRADILEEHPAFWRSVRFEVEQWVRENYCTWTEEKPEWFTERWKKRIPAEFIPDEDDKSDIKKWQQERKSSIGIVTEDFGNAVRVGSMKVVESLRRTSVSG